MSQTEFCHIVPTKHLNLVEGRSVHLVLAHLVEEDPEYVDFYLQEKANNNCTIILDNSGFELFKQGKPMMDPDKLITIARQIDADYIVMTDHPGKPSQVTIDEANILAPQIKAAGFKTFFVPQGEEGNVNDLLISWAWAVDNPGLVDYIALSILSAPLAFGVESGNKLQRFVSRLHLMYILKSVGLLDKARENNQKIHFLGMVDGPNEIMYMSPFADYIDTWDSSASVWLGLNGEEFDSSPTGRMDGKFEKEVDFNFETSDQNLIQYALSNINYIDYQIDAFLNRSLN